MLDRYEKEISFTGLKRSLIRATPLSHDPPGINQIKRICIKPQMKFRIKICVSYDCFI